MWPLLAQPVNLPPGTEPTDDPPAIVNGREEEGFPSAVGLSLVNFTECSGSVVTPRLVITAAHCAPAFPDELLPFSKVLFGSDAMAAEHELGIVRIDVHPDYVPLTSTPTGQDLGRNDVAILVLDADAPVAPVWFRTEPFPERRTVGEPVVSVGWGDSEDGFLSNGTKRSADLVVSEVDEVFLRSDSADNPDGANICSGDSGGPQYHLEDDGTWVQWAVHSWGDDGCRVESGSTRLDVVADWVLEQIEAEHGTRDVCALHGRYDDGICDPRGCDEPDPDCVTTLSELRGAGAGAPPTGCSTAPGSAAAGIGWGLVLLPLLRRRQSSTPSTG